MIVQEYKKVMSQLRLSTSSKELASLSISMGVDYDTLVSIWQVMWQTHIKKTAVSHKEPNAVAQYCKWYLNGDSIITIADKIKFPPCLVARMIMEMKSLYGMSKTEIANVFKNPSDSSMFPCLRARNDVDDAKRGAEHKEAVAPSRTNMPTVPNRLQKELQECIDCDEHTSPFIDNIRHNIGLEYEYILKEKLKSFGIPFITEEQMRSIGHPKTPDVRLLAPIAINGKTVNWIDSKAMFGDPRTHQLYAKTQFHRYSFICD